MRVNGISSKNFLGLKDQTLAFTEKVSLLWGDNGMGKSSCLDTVETTIRGICRGLLKKQASSLATIADPYGIEVAIGAKRKSWSLITELQNSDGEVLTARRMPSKLSKITLDDDTGEEIEEKYTQSELIEFIGADEDTLQAVFEVWHVMNDLKPQERIALALRLSGRKCERSDLQERGLTGDILNLAANGEWKKAHALATEKKRERNRAANEMDMDAPNDPVVKLPGGDKKASEISPKQFKEFKAYIDKQAALISETRQAITQAEVRAEVTLDSLQTQKSTLLDQMRELDPKTAATEILALKGELEDLETSNADLLAKIKAASDEADEQGVAASLLRERIRDAKGHTGKHACPICGDEHEGPERIDTSEMEAELLAIEEKQIKATREADTLSEEGGDAGDQISEKMNAIADRQKRVDRARALREDLKRVDGEIQSLEQATSSPEQDLEDLREKLTKAIARKDKVESVMEIVRSYRNQFGVYSTKQKGAERLREEAGEFEAQANLCLPKGIQAELVLPVVDQVREYVAKWSHILPFEVEISNGFDVQPVGRPLETVSGSEKYRITVMLAAAFSQLSGLRFLKIDEVPSLTATTIKKLLSVLRAVQGDFDQILVGLPELGSKPKGIPESTGLAFYWVEDGVVERLVSDA